MEKMINFVKEHLDFKIYGVTWIAVLVGLALFPALKYMPQTWGYENGVIENTQMCVLFVIFGLCVTSKVNKKFFRFAALALTLIIIREVNCGRTLFFPIPDTYHQYYSWRDLPWKWLGKVVHTVYGLYIAFVSIVFLRKKIYIDMWKIIKNIKLPVWNLVIMGLASFFGAIAEKLTNNNFVFEEWVELLFYVALMGLVYLYSRNKNFAISIEEAEEK